MEKLKAKIIKFRKSYRIQVEKDGEKLFLGKTIGKPGIGFRYKSFHVKEEAVDYVNNHEDLELMEEED